MEYFDNEIGELKQKLLTMASHAETAVNRAVEALVTRNLDLALQVKTDDNILDQLEVEVDNLAIHLLSKAPLARDLRFVTVAMKISQNLERIADHATNVAEEVVYLCEAQDIRHTNAKQV